LSGSSQHRFIHSIQGQKFALELLSRAIDSGRLASAYLFRGPAGVGKFAAALGFIARIKCSSPETCDGSCHNCRLIAKLDHPDIDIILPLPKTVSDNPDQTAAVMLQVSAEPLSELSFAKPASIGIDEIRELSERLALTPTSPGGRWAVIRDADSMTPQAANAFLKTLEEPPEDTYIILTSSRPDYLLPTIRSRTQPVRFTRLSRPLIEEVLISRGFDPKKAHELALAADGSISSALAAAEETSTRIRELGEELWVTLFSRNDAKALNLTEKLGNNRSLTEAVINSSTSFLRDHLLALMGLGELIRNLESRERIDTAADRFKDTRAIIAAIQFLQERSTTLHFNPQYDLFWMDLILRGRQIIAGKRVSGG